MSPALLIFSVALLLSLAPKDSFGGEIINGNLAKKGCLQYMASVQKDGKHVCGGFLVSPNFVLTATHCDKGKNMSVILGTQNIHEGNKNIQRFIVKSRKKPKAYKDVTSGNDIMLLQLSKTVKLRKPIGKVKIPLKDKNIKPNTKCLVPGWGPIKAHEKPVNNLHVVSVTTIDLEVCQNQWSKVDQKLPTNILCAGGYQTKSGACQGDSGGPLVCEGLAVGIVSFNLLNNCDYPNVPNVYTQISKFLPWIKKFIKNIS